MELNDREKFIVHFMAAYLFGMRDNASEHAINCAIEKLRKARCESVSPVTGQKLIDEILDEATSALDTKSEQHIQMSLALLWELFLKLHVLNQQEDQLIEKYFC